MDTTIVCGRLAHGAMGASRTDRTGGVCIFGGIASIEGMIAVPRHSWKTGVACGIVHVVVC